MPTVTYPLKIRQSNRAEIADLQEILQALGLPDRIRRNHRKTLRGID